MFPSNVGNRLKRFIQFSFRSLIHYLDGGDVGGRSVSIQMNKFKSLAATTCNEFVLRLRGTTIVIRQFMISLVRCYRNSIGDSLLRCDMGRKTNIRNIRKQILTNLRKSTFYYLFYTEDSVFSAMRFIWDNFEEKGARRDFGMRKFRQMNFDKEQQPGLPGWFDSGNYGCPNHDELEKLWRRLKGLAILISFYMKLYESKIEIN